MRASLETCPISRVCSAPGSPGYLWRANIAPMRPVVTPLFGRRLSPLVVVAALLAALALAAVLHALLFGAGAAIAVIDATGGFVNGTLLANAVQLAVVVVGWLVVVGGARALDLGLQRAALLPAALAALMMWVALHGIFALAAFVQGASVTVAGDLAATWRASTAQMLGQLFGNALFEEILFRGCLLGQLALWLTPPDRMPQRREVVLATLWSQAWFAVHHVPNRLASDAWHGVAVAAGDLLLLWAAGISCAAVWLRTRNLLVAVGYHSLCNSPFLLLHGPGWLHPAGMAVLLLVLVVVGPRLRWLHARGGRATDSHQV